MCNRSRPSTEEMTSSITEIGRRVQESARMANDAVGQARSTTGRVSELSKAATRIGDVVETDQYDRRPNQLAGIERHHRSRPAPARPGAVSPWSPPRSRRWPSRPRRRPARSVSRSPASRPRRRSR